MSDPTTKAGIFRGTKEEFFELYGNPESWGAEYQIEDGVRIGLFSVGAPWKGEEPRVHSANLTLVPLQRVEEG